MAADPANFPRRRDLRPGEAPQPVRRARGTAGAAAVTGPAGGPGRSSSPAEEGSPPFGPTALGSLRGATRFTGPAPERTAPHPAHQLEPAGRHANTTGDGFGRLVALTILGAALPGVGLVLAGWRRLGALVLTVVALLVAAAVALAVTGEGRRLVVRWGTDPTALLAASIAIVVVALVWCLVIVASHLALRRDPLTAGQRVLAVVLVTALMGIVSLPSAVAARITVSGRSALTSVFDDDGSDRSGLANPDVAAVDPWADTPRVNVLLLGSDAGVDRTGIRPDTIFVASIDTRTGDAVLFNVPRNLRFAPFPPGSQGAREHPEGYSCGSSPETDECILNAVWQWGELHPEAYPASAEPGLAATRDVVGQVLGLVIDYDVVVNLRGFEEVVDAMGGLRIDVERDIPIGGGKIIRNGREVGTYPVTGYVAAGEDRLLSGYEALWYARSREGSDDNDRMIRQRCTVSAAVAQFDVARLARAFPAIAASAERNIETDIRSSQLPAFVELGRTVQAAGSLRSLAFTNDVIDTGDPDYDVIQQLVQEALLPPAPTPTATPSATASATATPTPAPSSSDPAAPVTPTEPTTPPGQAVDTAQACG